MGRYENGYRLNVGIVLCNAAGEVFWARRVRHDGWQFPQGGIRKGESTEQAMYRELHEEVGLATADVEVVGRTRHWLYYELPAHLCRRGRRGFRGQKQTWFLLRLCCEEKNICLDGAGTPEFDAWQWISYWQPVERIIEFKRDVYQRALRELEPLLTAGAS